MTLKELIAVFHCISVPYFDHSTSTSQVKSSRELYFLFVLRQFFVFNAVFSQKSSEIPQFRSFKQTVKTI